MRDAERPQAIHRRGQRRGQQARARILAAMREAEERGERNVTLDSLRQRVGLALGTTHAHVRLLEVDGFVRTIPGRHRSLRMTPRGRELTEDLDKLARMVGLPPGALRGPI